jgi:uncharacterized delta-60 repeat protein
MPKKSSTAGRAAKGGRRVSTFEKLEARRLLSVSMVKDLDTDTEGSDPSNLVDAGGTLFFAATDRQAGRELWKTTGSADSTQRVADLNPGTASSNPVPLAGLGSRLVFTIDGGGLWASDGTAAGTQKISDVVPATNMQFVAGDRMYFGYNTPGMGTELWVTDGTAAGTMLVKDIAPGAGSSYPLLGGAAVVGGVVYFAATDTAHGNELWRTDGTDAGTYLVKDINTGTGPGYGSPLDFTAVGSTLFFTAVDGAQGRALWKSDGTAAGTQKVAATSVASGPAILSAVGSTLYFAASDGVNGTELFTSDGTSAGTKMVRDLTPGSGSTTLSRVYELNGAGYFWTPTALWRTDGTPTGTVAVDARAQAVPSRVVQAGGALFYIGGSSAPELWRTDGTTAGTTEVTPRVLATPGYLQPYWIAASGGTFYFRGRTQAVGNELFRVDPGAVTSALVRDVNASAPYGYDPVFFQAAGDYVYFLTRPGNAGGDYLVWRTDGTAAGTVMVLDTGYNPFNWGIADWYAAAFGDSLVFTLGGKVWVTGPQPGSGRVLLSGHDLSKIVVAGDRFYFAAGDPAPTYATRLWASDGQTAWPVSAVSGGGWSIDHYEAFGAVGGVLYFEGVDAGSNAELWRTDGTAEGTWQVKDLLPGTAGSYPTSFFNVDGRLFFTALDANAKRRVWTSDGTAAGTVPLDYPLLPTVSGTPTASVRGAVVGDELYLIAATDDATADTELWRTDGTAAGTRRVLDMAPGLSGIWSTEMLPVGDKLYFVVGGLLFVTDGTQAGTVALSPYLNQDTLPDQSYGFAGARRLTQAGGMVYFVAGDNARGIELCRTDGTPTGTVMVDDINPGPWNALYNRSTYIQNVTTVAALGDAVVFGADDGSHGFEVWRGRYDGEPLAEAGDGYVVTEGQSITVSGAGSRPGVAADGGAVPIVSYEWDLNFGGVDGFTVDATGVTATFGGVDGPATRTIALRVTDALGRSHVDISRVTIVNAPPRLAISGTAATVAEGSPYTLNLSYLGDAGPDAIKSWQIYWGDGTSTTVAGNPSSVTHVYANGPARYAISASATDEDGTYTTSGLTVATLDASFGSRGVVADFGTRADASLVVQPDERVIAVGGQDDFELARYLPSGAPDTSFGAGGHVVFDVTDGGSERATSVVLLPDGRILVGGSASAGTAYDWVLARFLPDGSPDPSFGTGGRVRLDLGADGGNELHDLVLLADGKVVAAGSVNQGAAAGGVNFAAVRLDAAGGLDATFGTGGVAAVDFAGGDDRAYGVGVQRTGKIVLGGTSGVGGNTQFALARFTPDGQLDAGPAGTPFATGKSNTPLPGYPGSSALTMAMQADDKIVLAGWVMGKEYAVARYDRDGALDKTFGGGDGVWTNYYYEWKVADIAVSPAGQIALIGTYTATGGVQVGRLTPEGGSDLTFTGANGIFAGVFPLDLAPGWEQPSAVAVGPDGNLVFLATGQPGIVLARLAAEPADAFVDVTNVGPTGADIGPDRTVAEGTKASFTATFTDPGVDPWVYLWRVTDAPGRVVAEGTTKTFDFIPADDGVYTVQFTVTDDGNQSSSDTTVLTVTNVAPTAAVTGPATAAEGTAVTFNSTVTDPGTADVLTRQWSIRYPDGRTIDGGGSLSLAFTPPDNGTYTVTLVVSDDDGGSSSATATLSVTNVAPTLTPGVPASVYVGQSFNLTFGASDPGQDLINTWAVYWGDGRNSTIAGWTPSVAQSYAAAGRYTITIYATDEDGTYGPVTRTILVNPRPALSAGTLTVTGTGVADTVSLTATDDTVFVSINGLESFYPLANVQRVNVSLLDGNDTLLYTGPVPGGTADLGNGNDTFTLDAGDTAAAVSVLGGAGTDTVRINAGAARPVDFQGGADTDSLYVTATASDDAITLTPTSAVSTGGGMSNAKSVTFSAVEYRSVDAGAGNDTVTLLDTSIALADQLVSGNDGDDTFLVGTPGRTNVWDGRAQFAGGNGTDRLVYNDQASGRGLAYTLTATALTRTSAYGFTQSTIEAVTLNTGALADRIDVTPSTSTAFTVDAGNPTFTTAPADRLGLPAGTTGQTLYLTGIDSGGYTFTGGRQPITFAGVEQLSPPDSTRPTVTSAAFRYDRALPSVDVTFSENVLGGVDLGDLQVTDLGTGQLLPAGTFFLNVSGGLLAATSASWVASARLPDGNYRAKLPAGSIVDPSGNALLSDYTLDFFVLAGDANRDRVVNFADLLLLAKNYGKTGATYAQGDFDANGVVNFGDLLILAKNYNKALPAPGSAAAAGVISIGSSEMPSLSAALAAADDTAPVTATSTPATGVPQPVTSTPPAAKPSSKPTPNPTPHPVPKPAKVPPRAGAKPPAAAAPNSNRAVAAPPPGLTVFSTKKVVASKRLSEVLA